MRGVGDRHQRRIYAAYYTPLPSIDRISLQLPRLMCLIAYRHNVCLYSALYIVTLVCFAGPPE